jgi:hypothetical protein
VAFAVLKKNDGIGCHRMSSVEIGVGLIDLHDERSSFAFNLFSQSEQHSIVTGVLAPTWASKARTERGVDKAAPSRQRRRGGG